MLTCANTSMGTAHLKLEFVAVSEATHASLCMHARVHMHDTCVSGAGFMCISTVEGIHT